MRACSRTAQQIRYPHRRRFPWTLHQQSRYPKQSKACPVSLTAGAQHADQGTRAAARHAHLAQLVRQVRLQEPHYAYDDRKGCEVDWIAGVAQLGTGARGAQPRSNRQRSLLRRLT